MLIQSPASTPSPIYTTCTCQCPPTPPVCACLPAPASFSHSFLVLGLCSGLITPTSAYASFHDAHMSNVSSGLTPPMLQCPSKRVFTDSSLPPPCSAPYHLASCVLLLHAAQVLCCWHHLPLCWPMLACPCPPASTGCPCLAASTCLCLHMPTHICLCTPACLSSSAHSTCKGRVICIIDTWEVQLAG